MEQLFIDNFNYHYLNAVFKIKNLQNEIFYGKFQNYNDFQIKIINIGDRKKYKSWYWKYLSNQPNINWNIVKNNLDQNWNFKIMSLNENITFEIIKNHPYFEWDYELFCSNINFNRKLIKQTPKFSIIHYSRNPNFSLDDLIYYKEFDIDWDHISCSKIINLEFVINNLDKKWNWESLSSNSYFVNYDKYHSNSNLPWNMNGLIQNKNFSFEQLQTINSTYYLFFNLYSNNENIDWNLLDKYPNMNWDFEALSKNKSLTWDFLKENLDLPWSWYELSQHKNITMEIIFSNKHLYWNWESVSKNINISPEIILNNLDLQWNPINLILNNMKISKKKFVSMKLKSYTKIILCNSNLNEDCVNYISDFL